MLVIMYHFIGSNDDSPVFNGSKGITVNDLDSQIDFLIKKDYRSSNADEIAHCFDRGLLLPEKTFYLTFDDGIRQHLTNVLPVLKSKGLEGAFFIPTMPLKEKILPAFEKQRILQYCLFDRYEEFLKIFCSKVRDEIGAADILYPTTENIEQSKGYLKPYTFYSNPERYFRQVRNEYLTNELFNHIIKQMFAETYGADNKYIREYYLSDSDVIELQKSGMTIGGHSHSHPLLTKIPHTEMAREIDVSHRYLSGLLKKDIDVFAYPYGAYNDDVIDYLKSRSIKLAFDTIPDGVSARFNIHRFDVQNLMSSGFFNAQPI